ncbi:phosphoglucosamine mutase [Natranaerobius trueperi]|uniref:Phosphoglucosamine mutase n=1 Tax=Natranaerobius trueperi TaxID=759412 RepID=A0A226BZN4_9FIRM|nr:phosphoglucosamine mutase [Natranaerobius trueperi]OWZ84446.1 phosphoglucosamine mutase [Natranaerobius trueperi]
MPELFGTDGIRGIANKDLTPDFCLKLGRAAGEFLKERGDTVLIGRDTRLSGTMLEASLAAGLTSVGLNVELLGIVSTPMVAYLTNKKDVAGGAMISASHNPVPDNGVKFFDDKGYKLSEDHEITIEDLLNRELSRPTGIEVGKISKIDKDYDEEYIFQLLKNHPLDLTNYKIVLDCAFGATYKVAPRIFKDLGAEVIALNTQPKGEYINVECGSTDPELASKAVIDHKADLGFSFDGDGDRIIAIDEEGNQTNGDKIMTILASYYKEQNKLSNNILVTTVMSNLGLKLALEEKEIIVKETKVGDRYVLEEMKRSNSILGGEQSGHIINLLDNTTGDGVLTALKLMEVITSKRESLKSLASIMKELPQVLVNVKVSGKKRASNSQNVQNAKNNAEKKLGETGRVLLRPSGTEPVIRVMVEGKDRELLHQVANDITQVIKEEAGEN